MSQDLSDSQLKDLWRQGKIPVIFKRNKPLPVLARIPFAEGNMEWLRDGRRLKPDWCAQFKAWEIPTAWFDSVIKLALRRHQEVYVIQLYREHQKCAPACWNAEGFHCECSCMGRTTAAVIQAAAGTRFPKPLPCPGGSSAIHAAI